MLQSQPMAGWSGVLSKTGYALEPDHDAVDGASEGIEVP
jgi:hypothetical protein